MLNNANQIKDAKQNPRRLISQNKNAPEYLEYYIELETGAGTLCRSRVQLLAYRGIRGPLIPNHVTGIQTL